MDSFDFQDESDVDCAYPDGLNHGGVIIAMVIGFVVGIGFVYYILRGCVTEVVLGKFSYAFLIVFWLSLSVLGFAMVS